MKRLDKLYARLKASPLYKRLGDPVLNMLYSTWSYVMIVQEGRELFTVWYRSKIANWDPV